MRLRTLLLALALSTPTLVAAQVWAPLTTGTSEVLADVHFTTETMGFAVADGGLLLTTADGGDTWNSRILNAGLDNQGIAVSPSGATGIIVTDDGGVLRTVDGGVTWTFVATGMSDGRAAIAWGTESVVWVAGRDGDAAMSTDSGASWTSRPSGSVDRTEGMAAAGPLDAWVVGRSGEIRHTADGGVTWQAQQSGTVDDLKDIQMLDASTGYIAGSGNTALKTTDGGSTWTSVATSGVSGNGLFFRDVNTGWLAADFGQIWATSDGGASWTLQPSGTSQSFNRMHFPSATRGFAVGDGGTVVRFTEATTELEGGPGGTAMTLRAGANPARETVAVTLALARPQDVAIEAFDLVGRRVALLHAGALSAGTHAFSLDSSALTPGRYLVRAAGESTQTVTITILR